MHRRTIFCASLECVRAQTKLLMQQLMEPDGQLSTSANIARVYEPAREKEYQGNRGLEGNTGQKFSTELPTCTHIEKHLVFLVHQMLPVFPTFSECLGHVLP
nr:hypothetical protein Iba_chr12bCG9840 [Ipomoea batatas]